MKPLSQMLRQARERRQLSLQEVARLTRLPLNSLHLLEGEGDQRALAAAGALLTSLRGYAAFLNLNPGVALTQFLTEVEQLPPVEKKARGSARPTQSLTPFPQPRSRVLPRTTVLLLVLGLLAFVGHYRALTQGPQLKEATVAPLPAPSGTPPAPQPWPPPPASSPTRSAAPAEAGQSEPSSSPPTVSLPVIAAPQAQPAADAAPLLESQVVNSPSLRKPPGSALHRLRVQATGKTWLHVMIDAQPMKRVVLHPGQSVEWSATSGFVLSLGNAGAIKLTLDGQALPPVGKAGQMVLNVRLPSPRRNRAAFLRP